MIAGDASTRSAKADQRGLPIGMARMMGLETAATLMGSKVRLAEALRIDPRALRRKLDADRGVSDRDLTDAADALEALSNRMLAHAGKLRGEVG